MEQQQFKVSFSLGTKLLISVVALLALVILFLNVSTILILKEDKRAYVLQAQSTEAVLAGREFVNTSKHVLDTLRSELASVDPRKELTADQMRNLKMSIDNQSDIVLFSISLVDPQSGQSKEYFKTSKDTDLQDLKVNPENLRVMPEDYLRVLPDLQANAYGFVNLSKLGDPPMVGVLLADLNLKDNPGGIPIAVGVISLRGFGVSDSGQSLTIATKTGAVLFDRDPNVLYNLKTLKGDALFDSSIASKLANGAQEFEQQDTRYLGSFVQPGLELVSLSRTEWSKAMRATYTLTEKFILLGLMAVGAAVIFAIFFSKTLTAPIQKLYQATREVARGNFDLQLPASSKDEIGALTGSFNVMSTKIRALIKESMEKVHLENELAIASTVQQTLIPPATFKNNQVLIQSVYQSASECGGDWWGFFGVGNKLCIMIADATGHGLPSALMTASARSCFSVMHKLAQEDPEFSFSPGAMLSYANRVIHDASLGKIMMTFFIGVIDFDTAQLNYSSAGHNPPWLYRKSEAGKFELKSLMAKGQRLGESRDAPDFEEKSLELKEDDILFLYTDGLMEGKDRHGDMYGKKRVRKMIEANVAAGPKQMLDQLMFDFLDYNQGKSLDDDVTLAILMIQKGAFHSVPVAAPRAQLPSEIPTAEVTSGA